MLNIRLLLIPILLISLTVAPFKGQVSSEPVIQKVEARELDNRAKILADYFASYNSPLEYHAQDFIDASDKHGVDWKLVPAISGVESTFGKHSYSFNGWGWGIYGDSALGFNSWKEGIYTVTEGLKQNYIDKGLTNPYSMNKKYAASPTWGWKVDFFMKDLDRFAQDYKARQIQPSSNLLAKTAGSSAQVK